MKKLEINGKEVNILAEHIKYNGQEWTEVDEFPMTPSWRKFDNGLVANDSEDWVVLQNEDFILYMNNGPGYMVLIELEKTHYEENKGLVTDRPGRILFTYI